MKPEENIKRDERNHADNEKGEMQKK